MDAKPIAKRVGTLIFLLDITLPSHMETGISANMIVNTVTKINTRPPKKATDPLIMNSANMKNSIKASPPATRLPSVAIPIPAELRGFAPIKSPERTKNLGKSLYMSNANK